MSFPVFKPGPKPEKPDFFSMAKEMCVHPQETMRVIVDYDPHYMQRDIILALSAVSGLLAIRDGMGMMLLEAVLNFILLVAGTYSMAALLWLTGKPFGGKATFVEICAALIWPMIPAFFGTIVTFFLMFTGVEFVGDLLQGVCYLYSFHIMVNTVAEVQDFTYWQSFWNQLLALFISILPFLFFIGPIINLIKTLIPLG
jgi:hypothetical protein